jgi:hypothetical protein
MFWRKEDLFEEKTDLKKLVLWDLQRKTYIGTVTV